MQLRRGYAIPRSGKTGLIWFFNGAQRAQFSATDATNITNSVAFNAPTVDITNSTFGRIRNSVASSSRKIQIGAKFHF
jgi:hypothetical protein